MSQAGGREKRPACFKLKYKLRAAASVMRRAFVITILCLVVTCHAQFSPASPPIADPSDTRFEGVTEDWSSPSLTKSNLKPVQPVPSAITDRGSYTIQIVRVQWRWGDPIDLYIGKPKGVKKPPVILYLYGFRSDSDRFLNDEFQMSVTKEGFAAVGFVSALSGQRFHDRPLNQWFISELQESLAVSTHDVQMVINYLASRGDFDMERVGMFAQDSGASIAILTSAVDARIKVLDAVNPWGNWPEWLAASPVVPEAERPVYLKPEFLEKVAPLDPIIWMPKIQAKKIRLQEAMFSPSTPKAVKEKFRQSASTESGRVTTVIYQTQEETKSVINGNNVLAWMEHELQSVGLPSPNEKLARQDQQQAP